ncbi:MAG: IS3 family transposase, partial [Erysipelotrichales bacterium]
IEICKRDCPYRTTFHSDGGWAYKMYKYKEALKRNKIYQSMSRKATSTDNSPMENFFGLLKQEMYYGETFKNYDELKIAIEEYIKYYNNKRRKGKLKGLSPIDYLKQKDIIA